jgi:hypothetical protein
MPGISAIFLKLNDEFRLFQALYQPLVLLLQSGNLTGKGIDFLRRPTPFLRSKTTQNPLVALSAPCL